MIVLEEVEQWTYIWVPIDDLPFHPPIVGFGAEARRIPRSSRRKNVGSRRDRGHNIDLDGDRPVLWMPLPAVSQNTRLYYLLDDQRWLHG